VLGDERKHGENRNDPGLLDTVASGDQPATHSG
jgi:hypothetical protein